MRSLIVLFVTASLLAEAQTPTPQWTFTLDSPASDDVQRVVAGIDGSVIVTGRFEAAMDMDPGAGILMLNPGTVPDPEYVARYTSDGTLAWAFPLLATEGGGGITDIAIGPDGTLFLAIALRGTLELAPLNPSVSVTATSLPIGMSVAQDYLIVAYDADGNYAWHKRIQGDGAFLGDEMHLAVRAQGQVLASCGYNGAIDLDQELTSSSDSLQIAAVNAHAFLVQYGSDGTFQWALDFDDPCRITGLADLLPGIAIALEPVPNPDGMIDTDPGPGEMNESDASDYLLLWDANGSPLSTYGITASLGHSFEDLVRTGPGDVGWIGSFEGIVSVGDSVYNNGTGPSHAYAAQINLMPYSHWSRYSPLELADWRLASRGDGSMHLAFELDDPFDPDGPSGPTPSLIPVGDDIGVVSYSATGAVVDAWQIGTATDDLGSPSIAVGDADVLFLGAQLTGTVDVYPGTPVMNASALAGDDGGLLVKYHELGTAVTQRNKADELMLWPVPARDCLKLIWPSASGSVHWQLIDARGICVLRGASAAGSSTGELDLVRLAPGYYTLHAIGDRGSFSRSFVKE